MAFEKAAETTSIPDGEGTVVEVGGKDIALFNCGGKFYATANTCLHAGGPLGEGALAGTQITCPWHGWVYDVTSGQCTMNPNAKVKTYAVEIRDGDIYVKL